MKLRRNKLGGLVVPVSSIGAAYKTKRKPSDDLCVGLSLGPEQLILWPNYTIQKVRGPVPFSQWYEAHKK